MLLLLLLLLLLVHSVLATLLRCIPGEATVRLALWSSKKKTWRRLSAPDCLLSCAALPPQEMAYAIREHSITAVPTFVGYLQGERAGAFSGADKGELQRLVRQLKGTT